MNARNACLAAMTAALAAAIAFATPAAAATGADGRSPLRTDRRKLSEDHVTGTRLHDHILGLADTLTSGIAAQFPDKVKG